MGYRIRSHHSNNRFRIDASDVPRAFEAALAWRAEFIRNEWSGPYRDSLPRAHDLGELLLRHSWQAIFAPDGSCVGIGYEGESSREEEGMFTMLAPFVAAGSFVEFIGEEGGMWRYYFDGSAVMQIRKPRIAWDP